MPGPDQERPEETGIGPERRQVPAAVKQQQETGDAEHSHKRQQLPGLKPSFCRPVNHRQDEPGRQPPDADGYQYCRDRVCKAH